MMKTQLSHLRTLHLIRQNPKKTFPAQPKHEPNSLLQDQAHLARFMASYHQSTTFHPPNTKLSQYLKLMS